MGHKRQSLHFVLHLVPQIGKNRCLFSVGFLDAMHLGVVPVVMVRNRLHQAIETLHDLVVVHDDQSHAARARKSGIGGFKIDGHKIRKMPVGKIHRLLLGLLLPPIPPSPRFVLIHCFGHCISF